MHTAGGWALVAMAAALALAACSGETSSGAGGSAASGGGTTGSTSQAGEGGAGAGGATATGTPTGSGGEGGAASPGLVAMTNATGWPIYAGENYRYGPSIIIRDDGSIDLWSSSPGDNGAWDYVRYRHSSDGGTSWTADVVALAPSAGTRDAFSTCDPGVIKIGSYWYLGYTSTENDHGTENHLYVARALAPEGPYEKWNGSGWGGAPQPIVTYTGDPTVYGIGEPSFVLQDRLYVYYSNVDGPIGHTDVSVVEPPVGEDWPAHLVAQGPAIMRHSDSQDSADVKYVDALGRFVAVATVDRFGPNASIALYQSFDGLVFEPAPFRGARVQRGAHNAGLSGTEAGHLDVADDNFIAYAYQPAGSSWGVWPTHLDPVELSVVSPGWPVWGGISSVIDAAGPDWDWSGPRAWDGDLATVASSNSHGATADAEEWIFVDLGAAMTVAGLSITPRPSGLGFPVDFTVQQSLDGASWSDVAGETQTAFPNPGSTPVVRSFETPVDARHLRLRATKLGADENGNHYLQLAELEPTF